MATNHRKLFYLMVETWTRSSMLTDESQAIKSTFRWYQNAERCHANSQGWLNNSDGEKQICNYALQNFDMNGRFSWAAARQTTEPEDKFYRVRGIFRVQMSLLYGEGRKKP
ncbi:hypothetical protein E8E12_007587 [Didymella heteroderae]|uniref:Uncharacterized protein n=1 Tax=Didymella heteroderae TaxID=1769908 RepID=A0A9P4WTQ6_9PLEO|nr:hypothetical protein E8E12_007587 [Didymella heteroderae]